MCGLDKTYIVLTGPFLTPVQTKITSVQKYDLQCSYNEPDDKTYCSTMYVRPAKTQVRLCIDPLYKASFLDSPKKVHTVRSAYGLIRMWCYSHTVYLALDSPRLSKVHVNAISECSNQNVQLRRLTRVFARRTRRFVKPIDCRRYIRLAKALIRLPMCRLRVCRLIRLFV